MYCVGWDYLYIPKPQRLNRLSLEMDTQFYRVLYRHVITYPRWDQI